MSYPSISGVLEDRGVNPETATDAELEAALWEAFTDDLPLGVAHLSALAAQVRQGSERILDIQDPNSPLGRQIARLLGADISRAVCEARLDVAFGFYNCCNTVVGKKREDLRLSMREQVMLQNGALASPDC